MTPSGNDCEDCYPVGMGKPRAHRRTKKILLLSAVAVGTGGAMLACGGSEDTNADGGTIYFNESGVAYDARLDAQADHVVGPGTNSPLPYDATADVQTDAQDAADAGDE
jgi:hypothetical protein